MSATYDQSTPAHGGSGVRHLSRKPVLFLLLLLAAISSSGCLVRSRERIKTYKPPTGWKETTLDALLASLRTQETGIKTLNATVDVEPSVTSEIGRAHV